MYIALPLSFFFSQSSQSARLREEQQLRKKKNKRNKFSLPSTPITWDALGLPYSPLCYVAAQNSFHHTLAPHFIVDASVAFKTKNLPLYAHQKIRGVEQL